MNKWITYAGRFVFLQVTCGVVPFLLAVTGTVPPEMVLNWIMLMFVVAAYLNYKNLTKPIEPIEVTEP